MTTIIIRTLNAANEIAECLDSLAIQETKADEILIIDNESSDETLTIAKKYTSKLPIRVINNPIVGYSTGLNIGAEEAKGDSIIYLSADCYPSSKDWLKSLLETQNQTGGSVVQGFEILSPRNNDIHYVLQPTLPTIKGCKKIIYFNNTNTLYSAADLKKFLPFEGEKGAEDVLMAINFRKSGLSAYLSYEAAVYHNKFPTPFDFKRRMIQHGQVSASMAFKKPLNPRLYLNPFYWSLIEFMQGISRRDRRFIMVGWWRLAYNLKGFFYLKKV